MENSTLIKFKSQIEDLKNTFREFGNIINAAEELYDHLNMDRSNLESIERKIKYIESSSENLEMLIQLSDKYMEQRLEFDEELSTLDKSFFMKDDAPSKVRISMLEITDDEGHRMFNRLLRDRFSRIARQQEVLELLRDVESSCLRMKAADHIDDSNDDDLVIISDQTVTRPSNQHNYSSRNWQPTSQSIPRKQHGDLEIDDDDDDEELIRKVNFSHARENSNNSSSRRSVGGTFQLFNQKSQRQQDQTKPQLYGELDLEELEKLRSSMSERDFNKLYAEMTSLPRETRSSSALSHKLQQKSVNNYFRRNRNADDLDDEGGDEVLTNGSTQKRGRRANMRNPYKGTDMEDFIVNDDEEEDMEFDANINRSDGGEDSFTRKRRKFSDNNSHSANIRHSEDDDFEPTVDAIDASSSSDAWEDVDEIRRNRKKDKNARKKKSAVNKNERENKDHTPPSVKKHKVSKSQKQLTLDDTTPPVQANSSSHVNRSIPVNRNNHMIDLDDDDDDDNRDEDGGNPTHQHQSSAQRTTPQGQLSQLLSPIVSSASAAVSGQKTPQEPRQQHPTPFKSPRTLPLPQESENTNTHPNNGTGAAADPSEDNHKNESKRSSPTKKQPQMETENDTNVQLQQLRQIHSDLYHSIRASIESPVQDLYWHQDAPPDAPVRKLSLGNKADGTNPSNVRSTHFEPIDLTVFSMEESSVYLEQQKKIIPEVKRRMLKHSL